MGVGKVGVGDSQEQVGAVGMCLLVCAIGTQARLCAEGVGLYVGCFCVYDCEGGVFCTVVVGKFLDEYFECCEALVLPFVWGFVFKGGSARLFQVAVAEEIIGFRCPRGCVGECFVRPLPRPLPETGRGDLVPPFLVGRGVRGVGPVSQCEDGFGCACGFGCKGECVIMGERFFARTGGCVIVSRCGRVRARHASPFGDFKG